MRLLGCTVAALLSLACSSAATARTELRITLWPLGKGKGEPRTATLRCDPAGGTLRDARAACRRLAALDRPFAPVPPHAPCTQIYGGPQVAVVAGTFRGRRVWAEFRRTNGCEIDRWNRVQFLFPMRG